MRAVVDFLILIRAVNCLIAALAVWVGALLTALELPIGDVVLTSVVAFLVCAGGNILNDVVDLEIDRINRPNRVLVRGAVEIPRAKSLVVLLSVIALVLAAFISLPVILMTALAVVLLFAYNLRLKRIPLLGNLVIALLSAMTFLIGGMAAEPALVWTLPGPLIPAVYAVLFHLVREILKDVEDIEGDRRVGVSTLPQKIGTTASLTIALALFLGLVVLTLVPIYYDWFGRVYEIITVYLVDLPLLALLIFVWGNPTGKLLRIGSVALKAGMLLGLVALLAGGQQI
ncbi:hypothetical protein GF420_06435 [candidate division GN15 bacterium]|nr:hypothetical protein [candidate division GN15 bacterium]